MTSPLGDAYIDFENIPVKIVAIRKIPAINTPGLVIEEADEGNTITVNLWIAMEFIEAGLAKLSDEGLSSEEWTQIHYRERFQPLGRPTPLPNDFYAKAYLTFAREMRGEKIVGPEFTELSMGMSGDYDTAIEEGATILRIGSAIFAG